MKRLLCHAIGCTPLDDAPACSRCGGALYYDFIDRGLLQPIFDLYYRVKKKLTVPRCQQCKQRLPWIRNDKVDRDFCSDRCFDEWIPF